MKMIDSVMDEDDEYLKDYCVGGYHPVEVMMGANP